MQRLSETQVAGVGLRAAMLSIHTVAAGGSSLLFDGVRYRVGPDAAGAHPGPASYRKHGPLTVTDCNVMLSKVQPVCFPAVFEPHGHEPLDARTVRAKFVALTQKIRAATGDQRTPEQVAEGCIDSAVGHMANASKQLSVQRGHDVSADSLCCVGGAAGQRARLVADALGMTQVFLHPRVGVLSAYGMGLADITAIREQVVEAMLEPDNLRLLEEALEKLAVPARAERLRQDVLQDGGRISRPLQGWPKILSRPGATPPTGLPWLLQVVQPGGHLLHQ
jgi:5-oxoprolinase (ATP-hydrolysing)